MSALSEALERQLKKIIAPSPKVAVKVAVPKATKDPHAVKSISLGYQEGTSDKVYHVQIVEDGYGWVVNFQYGRRGKTLIKGTKTSSPVSMPKAERIYWDLVNQKQAKGYREI